MPAQLCKNCGRPVAKRQRLTCSVECHRAVIRANRARQDMSHCHRPRTFACACCGAKFTLLRSQYNPRVKRHCCSPDCMARLHGRDLQSAISAMSPAQVAQMAAMRLRAHAESPLSGPVATNVMAKTWRFVSPDGVLYEFRNLALWLREHGHLFPPETLIPPPGPPTRRSLTTAYIRLSALRPDRSRTDYHEWRGWRWAN